MASAQRRSEQAISRKKAAKAKNVATYQTMVMTSMAVCDNSLGAAVIESKSNDEINKELLGRINHTTGCYLDTPSLH